MIKNFKKNQIVIFVIALMLVTAGYLNFTNQQENQNLLPTSTLADSEQMAAIGDATLVSANQITENVQQGTNTETISNLSNETTNSTNTNLKENTNKNIEATNETNASIENASNNNLVEGSITETSNSETISGQDSYFTQSRLDRENMYSQMLENYQKILETENLDSEEKSNAQEEIQKINKEKNAIMIAENLIKTKGFEDVVLFVNNGNVTGVIKAEKLDEQQISQIQNIITRELNVKVNKINISSKK